MQTLSLPIADLHPDPANPRRHSERNLEAIKSSLARFGQQKPIVIDANHVVRAGNGTLAAARALNWTHVDVVVTRLAGVEATAFAIADNRTAELAEWDREVLAAALLDPAMGDLGFDDDEIRRWAAEAPIAEEPPGPTEVGESFQIVVDCQSESRQRELFERLSAEGWPCRLLTL